MIILLAFIGGVVFTYIMVLLWHLVILLFEPSDAGFTDKKEIDTEPQIIGRSTIKCGPIDESISESWSDILSCNEENKVRPLNSNTEAPSLFPKRMWQAYNTAYSDIGQITDVNNVEFMDAFTKEEFLYTTSKIPKRVLLKKLEELEMFEQCAWINERK